MLMQLEMMDSKKVVEVAGIEFGLLSFLCRTGNKDSMAGLMEMSEENVGLLELKDPALGGATTEISKDYE